MNIQDRDNLPSSVTPLDFNTVLVLTNVNDKRVIRLADNSDDYGATFLELDMSYDPATDSMNLDIRHYNTNVYKDDLSNNVRTRIYIDGPTWKIMQEQIALFQTERRLYALAEPERVAQAQKAKEELASYPF